MAQRPPVAASPWSNWISLGGNRVHYVDTRSAQSGCSLLLLHGYLGSTRSFRGLIAAVPSQVGVVMPDLPGFGEFLEPVGDHSMEFYVDFVQAFSEAVGLERFYLAGVSIGANMAVHYTAAHPQQVQGLILISPFGLHDQAGRMSRIQRWDFLLPVAAALITRAGVERRLRRQVWSRETITPELVDTFWRPFATSEGRRAVVDVTRRILGGCSMNELLPGIDPPVLILVGSRDPLISPEEYREFRRLRPGARMVTLEECGHLVYLDAPDTVSQEILRFTMEASSNERFFPRAGYRIDLRQHGTP